ncbi:hypothetical protein PIIN_09239 [Serendipita indica DSM 11827]|uniref:Aminoglycoside phosphotransferase domain-containing protein n=1 Tax=Serendipita indica (strain DSM 11827) TaxID=1109443 RepID=G4TVB2_SERID|nr:hypothetical protein PIIN_09239 [Serendipita indica DSM 11827]
MSSRSQMLLFFVLTGCSRLLVALCLICVPFIQDLLLHGGPSEAGMGGSDVGWDRGLTLAPMAGECRQSHEDRGSSFCPSQQNLRIINHQSARRWSGLQIKLLKLAMTNGFKVVGRVLLPIGPIITTESEVATMDFIHARTSIAPPKVYLYCSSPDNPVRAEWILTEYIPGKCLRECFDDWSQAPRRRFASDLARTLARLYTLTASHCGCVLFDRSLDENQRSLRYWLTNNGR